MATEFRAMRRMRQELPKDETVAILSSGTYGVLSVIGDNGYPYGVPVNYVYRDGHIYLHAALSGHKVDAMRKNDKVSFTIVAKNTVVKEEYTTYFRSVIAFGRVRFITDESEKMQTLKWLGERYNPGRPEALSKEIARGFSHLLMVDVEIEHITGKEAIELTRKDRQCGAGGAHKIRVSCFRGNRRHEMYLSPRLRIDMKLSAYYLCD